MRLLERLRSETKPVHAELEASMMPWISRVRNLEEYAGLLRMFYGFYQPLDYAIKQHVDINRLPDFHERRGAHWILEDLQTIGFAGNELPLDTRSSWVTDQASAFGALYVMEGSTLGGRVICKTISGNLGTDLEKGLRFFGGYGPETGSRWKSFLSALDGFDQSSEEDSLVNSAYNTFRHFQTWIKQNSVPQISTSKV